LPCTGESLEQIASLLSNELRSLTIRLRPPILDEAGLISAINWQVDTFRKNYPDVDVCDRLLDKTDLRNPLSTTTEEASYRICQEALTNIARHASATVVQVTMARKDKNIELKIEDNGVGFDLKGCFEETERALMVGGTFKIDTSVGKGTSILATFPSLWRLKS